MPFEPLLAAQAVAAAGPAWRSAGVDEQFVIEFGRTLEPDSSAILALIRNADADRLLAEKLVCGGTVMQTAVASAA